MMMRLNLLYPCNRRLMAEWVKRRSTVVSSVPFFNPKAKAAYYCTATPTPTTSFDCLHTREGYTVLGQSQYFTNLVLRQEFFREHAAVSPSSFHLILSLLVAGSGVSCRRQFLDCFDVDSMHNINSSVSLLQDVLLTDRPDSSFGPRIRSSTSLWHHHSLSLHPSFLDTLHHPHRASIFPVDFHKTPLARQQINSRVEHDTNGLIKDLLPEESLSNSSVKLVLTNALHFKGDWDTDDDMQNPNNHLGCENHSARSRFHSPYPRLNVSYDYDWAESFYHYRSDEIMGAEIIAIQRNIVDSYHLELGHKLRRPSKDKRHVNFTYCYPVPLYDDFNAPGYSIPNETVMEVGGREIPKFNLSTKVDASTMLRRRGIILPFSGGGLTDMLSPSHAGLREELYLFKMLQKTYIDLNEQGTEAATATTAIIMSGCPPYLRPVGYDDREFYGQHIFHFLDGFMARLGLQVHQHV